MSKTLTLLRGINVSGQKKIKMDDLKALYADLGLKDVIHYIQSGNLVFATPPEPASELATKIETAIEQRYGFFVPVEIRNGAELRSIVERFPFGEIDPQEEGTRYLVSFLSHEPAGERISELMRFVKPPERLVVDSAEVYLHCPEGYGKSKLSNNFLEAKLKVGATTRNWKTVLRLLEMMS